MRRISHAAARRCSSDPRSRSGCSAPGSSRARAPTATAAATGRRRRRRRSRPRWDGRNASARQPVADRAAGRAVQRDRPTRKKRSRTGDDRDDGQSARRRCACGDRSCGRRAPARGAARDPRGDRHRSRATRRDAMALGADCRGRHDGHRLRTRQQRGLRASRYERRPDAGHRQSEGGCEMDDTTGRVTGTGGAYDDNPDVRTREIREEIAQTRVEMSETIEAIQERLTPGNLAAQAGETVRNAATEKVKQMAHTAEHAAEQIRESSFVETLRANPIPSAMIGIGAAWLMMKGRWQGGRARRYGEYPRYRVGAARDWRNETYAPTAVGTSGSTASTSGYDYGAGYSGDSGRVPEFGGDIRGYEGRSGSLSQGTASSGGPSGKPHHP